MRDKKEGQRGRRKNQKTDGTNVKEINGGEGERERDRTREGGSE